MTSMLMMLLPPQRRLLIEARMELEIDSLVLSQLIRFDLIGDCIGLH